MKNLFTKRILIVSVSIAVLLITCGIAVYSQRTEPDKFTVSIKIIGDRDNQVESLMSSHIRRELRSLQDVEVIPERVVSNSRYTLSFIVIEHTYMSGEKTGIVSIAYTVTESPHHPGGKLPAILDVTKEGHSDIIINTLHLVYLRYTKLRVGSTKNLPDMCIKIVAEFDTEVLEKARAEMR